MVVIRVEVCGQQEYKDFSVLDSNQCHRSCVGQGSWDSLTPRPSQPRPPVLRASPGASETLGPTDLTVLWNSSGKQGLQFFFSDTRESFILLQSQLSTLSCRPSPSAPPRPTLAALRLVIRFLFSCPAAALPLSQPSLPTAQLSLPLPLGSFRHHCASALSVAQPRY